MPKLLAFTLSFLSLFMLSTPQAYAQSDNAEATSYEEIAPDQYRIWPTTEFTKGRGPWWFSKGMTRLLYLRKGGFDSLFTESLLVMHKGKLIYERYSKGFDETTRFEIYSVTKSVVATLVGIAIYEGAIKSLDQNVIDFYPEADALLPADSSKRDMTVDHLITMTSGLDPSQEVEAKWRETADTGLGAFLSQQKYAPGAKYEYVGASTHVLACLVSRAVKMPLFDYAQEKLFEPLGMTSVKWNQWPDGSYIGPSEISMTARDMLRLGYLWLNLGKWEKQQLLSAEFIKQALPSGRNGYGRSFWSNSVFPFYLLGCYEAAGWGGQYISVYPFADIVVVRTGWYGKRTSIA